ncbi:NAD(P)/FAD-dependent oxidoreductase [Acidithiobacillus albertensis]|uniref:NAD(P)/FAD-dependent oxidoreductase n=1 Tax=Acidithiobacillus albertensis TaxID=119978 RepID=UPI00094B49B0|nr:FAD-binding oxidoreductase [Acidithiobacillus albertensis]
MQRTDNYYQATRNQSMALLPLDGSVSTDVSVIGGGLTGVSAALNLAERGYTVTLLEAQEIGWGASGRNGGQIVPGLAIDLPALEKLVGRSTAQTLWNFSLEAIATIRQRVEKHNIQCDLHWGYLHAAIKDRQVKELEHWQHALEQMDYPATQLLRGEALRTAIDSPRYRAALFDPEGGQLHPLNYTLGLAQAAIDAGANLYAHSPVKKINPGRKILIQTDKGQVESDFLLVCGNAYLGKLLPDISAYVMPVGTYIAATEILGERRAHALIPSLAAVADLNFVLDYFRLSEDHRLLFGGRVSYSTLPPPQLKEAMLRRMRQVFPQLSGIQADYAWGGNVAITRNRAPHFGRINDNIFFAQGFSGHGVALTGWAGKLMAEIIAKQSTDFDVFARIPHHKFPGGPWFRTPTLLLATTAFRLMDLL